MKNQWVFTLLSPNPCSKVIHGRASAINFIRAVISGQILFCSIDPELMQLPLGKLAPYV